MSVFDTLPQFLMLSLASPSEPESVRVVATNTTLTVAWDPPVSTGGRNDMFFNLSICLVASSTNDSQSTRETVTGKCALYMHFLHVWYSVW